MSASARARPWWAPGPGLAIFLVTFVLLAAGNGRLLFSVPLQEDGDFAANALQIDQAMHLREIHGNYSRFNFDHPGPAFFYVYALGEAVLQDGLHATASPAGAHLVAGLALQAAWFALALALARSWFPSRLFLPLALLVAAVHFRLATQVFLSIWPPHVLVMPFLAFWVACVSVAAGRGEHLPWAVLAGSFLVHGHVAQPLFVLTLFPCAYALLSFGLRQSRRPPPWKSFPRAHAAALAIFALFVAPLAIDLAQGAHSNFASILRHLHYDESARHPLSSSVLYFLSFFAYLHDQDARFAGPGPDRVSFLASHAALYASWAAAALASAAVLVHGRLAGPVRRVGWLMLAFWALTAALCVEWDRLQTGPMFDFNGYFFYAVIYALALLPCGLLAEWLGSRPPRWLAAALCGGAALVGAGIRVPPMDDFRRAVPIRDRVLAALAVDPRPSAPKLLVFNHDDWGTATTAALALERAGATVYVGRDWTFMFQRAHALPERLVADPLSHLSIWRLVHPLSAGRPIDRGAGLAVVFAPAELAPDGGRIACDRDGNLDRYALFGFVTPDADASWTDLHDAALGFQPLPARRDVAVSFQVNSVMTGRRLPSEPVEIWFRDVKVDAVALSGPGQVRFVIRQALWNRAGPAVLRLHLPDARSPAELRYSGDPRRLGLLIPWFRTASAGPRRGSAR